MCEGQRDQQQLVRENEVLKQRVGALQTEVVRFRTTFQSIGDAVISVDTGGNIVQMNPVAEALTGWCEAEVRGRDLNKVFRIVNEETRAAVESPVARVLREGVVVGLANHTLLIARDGTERPIADSGAPIRDDKCEMTGVVLVFRDQTAERLAQKVLEESETRFRTVFEGSPLGESMTGIDGRLSVNRAFCELLGYSEEELRTRKWQELTHPDDVEESARIVKALLDGNAANAHYEKRYVHKSGEVILTDVTTTLARDAQGSPLFFITTVSDITERKQVEEALREANSNLERRVLERTQELRRSNHLLGETGRLSRAGGWEIDLERNELTWTNVVHQIHEVEPGYRPTVEAGINFYAREAVPVISEAVRRAIEEGQPFDVELELITAKKNRLWVRAIGEAIRENGKITRVRGVFQDIHQRKLADLELKKHREHLEELVEQRTAELKESQVLLLEAQHVARAGSWKWNTATDEITGSPEFYRLFDVAPERLARFSQFTERLHPDDRERVQRDVAEALKQERPYDTDYRVQLANGGWRDINARGQVSADAQGKPASLVGTCLDITERKQAEEALRTSEAQYRTVVDNIPQKVFVKGRDFRWVSINRLFALDLGKEPEEIVGKVDYDLFPRDLADKYRADDKRIMETGATDEYDEEYVEKGELRTVHTIKTPVRDKAGVITGMLGVFWDVTERKRAEEAVRKSNEALLRSNQELEQFAYVASVAVGGLP